MLAAHVIIIGLRGSGKTTVGLLLARLLGADSADLDDASPRLMGYPDVVSAWAASGEAAFREAEARALAEVLAGPPRVIALGGGTPTAPTAESQLLAAQRTGARIVYLWCSPEVLSQRLTEAEGPERPSLTGHGAASLREVRLVAAARDPLYRRIADHTVQVEGLTANEAAAHIAGLLRLHAGR